MKNLNPLFFVMLFCGCNQSLNLQPSSETTSGQFFDKQFVHILDYPGVCDNGVNISENPFFNCKYRVRFEPNGQVVLQITDIMELGDYYIRGAEITAIFHGETSGTIKFSFVSADTLKDDRWSIIWKAQSSYAIARSR